MTTEQETHITENQIAAYVDRRLPDAERAAVELHLASCTDCQDWLLDVSGVLHPAQPARRMRWKVVAPAVAAAAAIILLVTVPRQLDDSSLAPTHREPPAATATAPTPLIPSGSVAAVAEFVWSTFPGADRYRVSLFDDQAGVVWKDETRDTVATLPDSIRIEPGRPYVWRVEARVGFDRWSESELAEFSVQPSDAEGPRGDGR